MSATCCEALNAAPPTVLSIAPFLRGAGTLVTSRSISSAPPRMRPPPAWLADGLGQPPAAAALAGPSSAPALTVQQLDDVGRLLDEDDARQVDLAQQLRVETGPQYAQQPAGVRFCTPTRSDRCRRAVPKVLTTPGRLRLTGTPCASHLPTPSGRPSCLSCSTANCRRWWRSACTLAKSSPSVASFRRSTALGQPSTTRSSSGATTSSTHHPPCMHAASSTCHCYGQQGTFPYRLLRVAAN